jgi:NAD-dependent SIR2 family protein deacetylase
MRPSESSATIERIAEWLERSPRVLIGAGAGLSVAAGLDYTDEESFARHYPGLRRRGFRACYELIGRHDLPAPLFWGYWAVHVKLARFTPHVASVYEALRRLTADKDVFVMTSNVEGLFKRHGFEADRIWTGQGDFAHMHCTEQRLPSCAGSVWPSEPIVESLLERLDPITQEVNPSTVPTCPACGGSVFFNVREDATFVETPYLDQAERCVGWIDSAMNDPLFVLEIGAGFNTPSVIRYPLERIAAKHVDARFVRINLEHPTVPASLGDRGLGIAGDARELVASMWEAFTKSSA